MITARDGFSLIEVIVAMVILSVGLLAMGASTGYVLSQVKASELRSDRMIAVRQASEELRAIDFDDLGAACTGQTFNIGRYSVTCSVQASQLNLARVQLISTGPGFANRRLTASVPDTTVINIAR